MTDFASTGVACFTPKRNALAIGSDNLMLVQGKSTDFYDLHTQRRKPHVAISICTNRMERQPDNTKRCILAFCNTDASKEAEIHALTKKAHHNLQIRREEVQK